MTTRRSDPATAVGPAMHQRVVERLAALEAEQGVEILHACESGSRAWGFPSRDSDYDVRFLYRRPSAWYLSVFPGRDVLEQPIDAELDLGGWDVRKALALMRRGNAPLLEWLASPIVYRHSGEAHRILCEVADLAFRPESTSHHYLAQTRSILRTARELGGLRQKPYFYARRALLAARWVIEQGTSPPMRFWTLVDALASSVEADDLGGPSVDELEELAATKLDGTENSEQTVSSRWHAALAIEGEILVGRLPSNPPPTPVEVFDDAFRRLLTTPL
ncbi:MAG: nucleotidyltransferase domain-containing protein [Acidobacteriota bacterium]